MFSARFLKFIDVWRNDFAVERSIDEQVCADKDGQPIPWYTYPAIEFLSQFDYHDKNVFEYGCGYSSSFWSKRAQKVISIEDNETWYKKWKAEFPFDNLIIKLRPEGSDYFQAIQETDDFFDVIIIDGKCRAECAKSALSRFKDGGIIILDDSDRINTSQEYVSAVQVLKEANLLQVDFYGFCPMNNYTKTTSVFFSRNFNFPTRSLLQPMNGIGNLWQMPRKQRKAFYKDNKF